MEFLFYNLTLSEIFKKYLSNKIDINSIGLVLARPDAYKCNKTKQIYTSIREEGCSLINVKVLKLEPWKFEQLYNNKTSLFIPNVWLFEDIYRETPCVAMIFTGNTKGQQKYGSLQEKFNFIKGNSSPSGDKIGIREKLGRMSSFHGIIHCSDSQEKLKNDLLAIYGIEELISIFSNEIDLCTDISEGMIYFYFDNNEEMLNNYDIIQFITYLYKKILATYCIRIRSLFKQSNLEKYIYLFNELDILSKEISSYKYTKKVKAYTSFQEKYKKTIMSLVYSSDSLLEFEYDHISDLSKINFKIIKNDIQLLLSIIPILSAYEGFNNLNLSLIHSILERGGVFITEWQKSLLNAALTTDMNGDSQWEGRKVYDRNTFL
jgi:nucleoside diphosphate kinase